MKFEPQVDTEAEDMISAVKGRRLLAIQAKKEREIQEREMKGKILWKDGGRSGVMAVPPCVTTVRLVCVLDPPVSKSLQECSARRSG